MPEQNYSKYPQITAAWLASHTRDDNGCLVWTGYSSHGQPKARLGPRGTAPFNVRRAVWEAVGNPLRKGYMIVCICDTPNCVELAHLKQVRWGSVLKGRKRPANVTAKMVATRRALSRISDAAVERIRASNESPAIVASREGCSKQYVHMLRRGEFRREIASPFAGLFA